ncbi:hypothetical protein TREMEDRAFT_40774 [Tremella mesenterica DSM 1558]|uniref:uncharacterized protein n=1 Tax=Tremella mesenterica (strain ATCC 24925 / CBS 8224 / DSM 1558 / NBRC 9311 / NRRL Y-6157 / RJB 2259-6 / UBC 559-6) TaxID=578456 RepID=UPI00032D26BF|nr:uncharacterized protein TREMEDRAFT_40774 [Tremella mesenterica DSM 1558]EIW66778.1 hypothetical protein TREMEDRAFT_40774 [Tremella mesenterica DSM 1558]
MRNGTIRSMTRTIRQASVRVVNIVGHDEPGMVRLQDENVWDGDGPASGSKEGLETEGEEMYEMRREEMGMDIPAPRPGPLPPEPGLRGRTLGLFGVKSRIRRSMAGVLGWSWTEPVILLLIIANVVVLAIQGSTPLTSPRLDPGYFTSWEDYVLFALFIVFTLEMFARMVVTGLILDPDTSIREYLFAPTGLIPSIEKHLNISHTSSKTILNRPTPIAKPHWAARRTSTVDLPSASHKKTTLPATISELPFQRAVARQQALAAYGRPYLRHSWHRIDLVAVVAFWLMFILAVIGQEATSTYHVYLFRALSVLRAARLLVVTSGTSTILHSLKRAGPLLVTVAYFVVFAGVLFSIIGVQSFRGSFRRQCVLTNPFNGSDTVQTGQACGGWLNVSGEVVSYLNLDGSVADQGSKGYICPMNEVCQTLSTNPNGNAQSFDNIFAALVQVIVISSVNTWAQTMYMAMDSDYYSSSLYFLSAVIVLNFWLINLVVAVVVNTFKDIRAATKRSAFGADQSMLGIDNPWANENKSMKKSALLRLYERTEITWVLLVVVDLVAQACRTASSSPDTLTLLKNLELVFTLVFDLEILIRAAGHIPEWKAFLASPRNSFDLFLALTCSIIQIPAVVHAGVYPWLTVFQLLRWYRVILAFPRMKPLLITVFGSFAGMLNLIVFLILINFIGALVAIQLLRGDLTSDQTITFSQTYNSFLGMYQIFSSENWTTVLYGAMSAEYQWAQGWLAAIFLCGWFLFAYFIVLQMFIAVINENFAVAEEQKRKQQIEAFIRKSEPVSVHVSWIDRLNPYRLIKAHHRAVKVNALPANLVLPLKQSVGAEVGGISNKMKAEMEKEDSNAPMRRLFGFERDEKLPRRRSRLLSTRMDDMGHMEDDDRGLTDLLPPLTTGPSADEHLDTLRERRNKQADFIAAHPSFDQSLWLFKQRNPIRRFCQSCVSPAYGERIFGRPPNPILRLSVKIAVFVAVVASIVVAAIATPMYRKNFYARHGIYRGTWFDLTEVALGSVFIFEAAIKIIADGFIFAPNAYLLSLWNVLDFIVLITLVVNTTTSLIFIGGLSRVTRALKSFRALRLITLFGRLRDTLHAVLFAGALKILDASILMILYIIPFAVWGVNIFAGKLYSCNDGNASGISNCINEYLSTPIDDSLAFLAPRVWENPAGLGQTVWNFDTFRSSILILFEIVSLEGWIDVMTSSMNIAGRDLQPVSNASQWNAIFFVIFNLLGAAVILALFVSIIIGNFSLRSGSALLTAEQNHWQDLAKFIKAQTPSQLPKLRPQTALREWCYERATNKHGYWTRAFTGLYYIHIFLLMTEDFSNNILNDVALDWVFLLFSLIYAIDILVRFYGLGFKSFRANGWNLFDVIVVTGSFATTIPALRAASRGLPGDQVNIQLQKLFLVSIALKLVQRISSLNQLFKTSVASLPAIGNLFLLWATLFIFFSILYLEVFGLTKQGDNSGSRFQNYYSFGNTLIMLAFMSTGEGWNGYMHDYTITFPRCTENKDFFLTDCGSPSWAFGLYIFVNMFTGVVVESFAYVYQMPGGASLNREEMRAFKKVWAEFDVERTGYIRKKDFIKFFSQLSGVFEVRPYPPEYSVHNIIRSSIPDPVANASGRVLVAKGVEYAVDVRKVETLVERIDFNRVRDRRRVFNRLYHEARISEEPGRGISFTHMLMMLSHYKLIDDEKALLLDDLLIRRAKTDRVTDLVNLERVRGLLRTIWCRKRFLVAREENRRALNGEAMGIPAIVLEPTPNTPEEENENPFDTSIRETLSSPSPVDSRATSPAASPALRPSPTLHTPGSTHSRYPSFSQNSMRTPLSRQPSDASMLSSEDAHRRAESVDEPHTEGYMESMATSVWGDMMRHAVDEET